jgi:hypothetical protein
MIFKKHLSILIAFLVLVSNSGLAFNVHFCEGKIANITSVFMPKESCVKNEVVENSCCFKPVENHEDCCLDKEVNIKNKSEKVIIKSISLDFDTVCFTHEYKTPSFVVFNPISTNSTVGKSISINAPPLFLLYNQYLFYA